FGGWHEICGRAVSGAATPTPPEADRPQPEEARAREALLGRGLLEAGDLDGVAPADARALVLESQWAYLAFCDEAQPADVPPERWAPLLCDRATQRRFIEVTARGLRDGTIARCKVRDHVRLDRVLKRRHLRVPLPRPKRLRLQAQQPAAAPWTMRIVFGDPADLLGLRDPVRQFEQAARAV